MNKVFADAWYGRSQPPGMSCTTFHPHIAGMLSATILDPADLHTYIVNITSLLGIEDPRKQVHELCIECAKHNSIYRDII